MRERMIWWIGFMKQEEKVKELYLQQVNKKVDIFYKALIHHDQPNDQSSKKFSFDLMFNKKMIIF